MLLTIRNEILFPSKKIETTNKFIVPIWEGNEKEEGKKPASKRINKREHKQAEPMQKRTHGRTHNGNKI